MWVSVDLIFAGEIAIIRVRIIVVCRRIIGFVIRRGRITAV